VLPKTLEVAIGVVFLYVLLTFAASAFVELISAARNWRPKVLHDSIDAMLRDGALVTVKDIYANPLVRGLGRDPKVLSPLDLLERVGWRPNDNGSVAPAPPSYLRPTLFSAAVLETLMMKGVQPPDLSPDGVIKNIRELTNEAASGALASTLRTTLASQGNSIQAVRLALEKWFNDTMDRASGWYKLRTQSTLLLLGLMIAFAANIDTIAVARWLWQGDAARQAVMNAASDYAQKHLEPPAPANKDDGKPPQVLQSFSKQVSELDQNVTALQYPIGWSEENWARFSVLQFVLGCLVTAIAISMGSTFWFDALQNLVNIRATGPKPGR
jgi:hypothetical protein